MKFLNKIKISDWLFASQLVLFALIITGILPREVALGLTGVLAIYFIGTTVERAIQFFVCSIPLFLALPIKEGFDNFNAWRILVLIIFLKWCWELFQKGELRPAVLWAKTKKLLKPKFTPSFLLIVLLGFALLSVIPAPDKIAAVKRIIYFLNIAMLGMVIYSKSDDADFVKRLIKNSLVPVSIVAFVGYIQVIATYFMDIYQFMRIWGEGIQCRQFGEQWCNIAVWLGNTWFAYYGEQLSLRVFSLFPDSHSFPQFVLLGVPALLAFVKGWKRILALSILFLIVVLSGTRGIWAASVGVVLLSLILMFWMRRTDVEPGRRKVFRTISALTLLFFAAIPLSFPIFSSPQFLLSSDYNLIRGRIRSIIDFGETSNAQRIEIWKQTGASIQKFPFLGVGIGNYPVVLSQDIRLADAGSSAHNLYLHVAAEMGVIAGVVFIGFLWLLFKNNYEIFIKEADKTMLWYWGAMLLYLPWILAYGMTDVAIFDERAMLFVMIPVALLMGVKKRETHIA